MPEPAGKFHKVFLPHMGLAVAVILVCLWGIVQAWRGGASRLLTYHGREAQLLAQSGRAVNAAPNDPEAHSGRAFVLLNKNDLTAALLEYERAVALRPRDYFLWLELGRARDLAEDEQGALDALEQAVRLAPAYAQPRWQLGNVLFRVGRTEDAYAELRLAALSDQTLLPNLIDLVWGASDNDPQTVEQVVQPERISWHSMLANFFIKHGKVIEGLAQLKAAGGIKEKDRQVLVKELLDAKRYRDAYEVWNFDSSDSQSKDSENLINDGGFESRMSRDNVGFGWQLARDTEGLRLSLDRQNPHSGTGSLRVDFNGDSNPGQPIFTQLTLAEPETRYRLRFAARMEEIVTGGLPQIVVSDISGKEIQSLGQPLLLPQSSNGWQDYSIDFTTNRTTALLISVQRQSCSAGACPIFGRMWLDDFVMQKLSGN